MTSQVNGEHEWSAVRVRNTFLDYFKKNGHTFVPSSSVVPLSDPTLLFTNAGMNQFKSIFLGTVDPQSDAAKWKRAVNSQKCIRAGGKHNDLEDVGKDSYHHTFFEMLGNWSFGDYFKKEAINFSWELLTKVYGLSPERLYVTYFEGYEPQGLEPDLEAKKLWRSVGVSEDHILPGDMKDNFWEMGGRNAAHLVNQDDPNVIEIWNNVFIQYNRETDRTLRPLPNKHVDTGMGFERLVSVLQDKSSNYDTDVFTPIFKTIQELTGAREYRGKFKDDDVDGIDTAYRVIADHVRTLTFAISDGAIPNNSGRGYVVRRILRRGARYARKYLNVEIGDFFSRIVPRLVEQMGGMFPKIKEEEPNVKEILNEEELSFAKTLDRGEIMFEKYAQQCKARNSKDLPGQDVWRLYETYGFPVDLTRIMAEERGLSINDKEVEEDEERAREASKGEKKALSDVIKLDVHDLGELEKMKDVPKTIDNAKFGRSNITAQVKALYHSKKFFSSTSDIPEGEQIGVLLNQTNFYAEQGGQEHDTGKILIDGEAEIAVQNVQVYGGYILHTGDLRYGHLSVGQEVTCEYDELRRSPIRSNHTGTHILNYALREVLGDEVNQKGSLVAPEKLRFDFSHKVAVTDAELKKIEDESNRYIHQNMQVFAQDVPLAAAREIEGVRAVFGETYPDPVRVVSIGVEVEDLLKDARNPRWKNVSIEFCGGTHVGLTNEIKNLVILEENGIAKGIRRIIAVTGQTAHDVQLSAESFSKELERLEQMPHGAEKEAKVKHIQVQLNELSISAVTKSTFRDRFAKISKQIVDEQKAAQKTENKRVITLIDDHFSASKPANNNDSKIFIAKLPDLSSANSKAIPEALKHVAAKNKDKTVYLFAADDSKVTHGCYIGEASLPLPFPTPTPHSKHRATQPSITILIPPPPHIQPLTNRGASASECTTLVAAAVGGKAFGKEPTSIGTGTKVAGVDEAVELARRYLEKFEV